MSWNRIFQVTCLSVIIGIQSITATAQDAEQIKAAVTKSVALLQPCDETFFVKTGCLACHQQSVTAIVVGEARSHGLKVDEDLAEEQLNLIGIILKRSRSRKLQRLESPFAQPITVGYFALAFEAQGYPADENTDAMIIDMAGRQTADGSWVAFSHRPPIEFSRISSTAFAVKAMQTYTPPTYRKQFQERIEKARKWLIKSKPSGNEEEVFRLLGLNWAKADPKTINQQFETLTKQQEDDGGWKQLPSLETDAYATATALYALNEAGMKPKHPVYDRGVNYLLKTQKSDGSWYVKSRSQPVQTYFESGFPHGHDQWISATATGWAGVVLLRSLK